MSQVNQERKHDAMVRLTSIEGRRSIVRFQPSQAELDQLNAKLEQQIRSFNASSTA